MWIYFRHEQGITLEEIFKLYFQADISSDTSGTSVVGRIDFPQGNMIITASTSEFVEDIVGQDIQIKEGMALKETLLTLIKETPEQIKSEMWFATLTTKLYKRFTTGKTHPKTSY